MFRSRAERKVADAGYDPAGRSALVLGAGGAARACLLALARGGVRALTVAARDAGRAKAALEAVATRAAALPPAESA